MEIKFRSWFVFFFFFLGNMSAFSSQDSFLDSIYAENEETSNSVEKLKSKRRILEKNTDQKISRKLEEKRIQSEKKLLADVEKSFLTTQSLKKKVVKKQKKASSSSALSNNISSPIFQKRFKVLALVGVTGIKTPYVDFLVPLSGGLQLEGMVSSSFSLGLSFNFWNLKGEELLNSYGLDAQLKQYSLGANTKFFFIRQGLIRPFIGMGLNYNLAKIETLNSFNNNGYSHSNYSSYNNFENEYQGSFLSGNLIAGMELRLSPTFGICLDTRFSKALVKGTDRSSEDYSGLSNSLYYDYYNTYGNNYNLEDVLYELEDSTQLSVNLGLMILF